ncbi:hypothetical protein FG379_003493 [Cryptosporidium bovis]|uniref:uncharacterized protein n=1 Tax=Cryptosporidium bovis TaxID=310047 RepID=UPI00351A176B|nr:hypothetical protein FG379_003493 [Cryptosporidium bovis]
MMILSCRLRKFEQRELQCKLYLNLYSQDNILYWIAKLKGPKGTAYEGGIYRININIPIQYPLTPPIPTFETPIFHPNINFTTGMIFVLPSGSNSIL